MIWVRVISNINDSFILFFYLLLLLSIRVKFAQNTDTGESVAMKVLDRSNVIKHKMVNQVSLSVYHVAFQNFV